MKKKTELKKLLGAFWVCAFLCVFTMTVLVGSEKARANSEYNLHADRPEYVTSPEWLK